MRRPKVYTQLTKRSFRSEISAWLSCGTRLRRYARLSARTVITLDGPIQLTHCGSRCPDPTCPTHPRSYRSAAADALALPGFTCGLECVILVGHLRLAQQHSLDQAHQAVGARLRPFALTISRRETLYLFAADGTLVRAAQACASDSAWQAQVHANGGLFLSSAGIQPDTGNQTVDLIRDLLSRRVLAAEHVRLSATETIKRLLAPVVALGLPLLGALSDAQESLLQAIAAVWPAIAHQICQFHYLRQASRPMYAVERGLRSQIRTAIQQPLRDLRGQRERHRAKQVLPDPSASGTATQLQLRDDYALAVQTARNVEGQQPFPYASLAVDDALTEIASSLERREKGRPVRSWRPN